jgi:hypothetical protein
VLCRAIACRVSYDFIQNPAILVPPLKHRPRPPEQDDLLRPRLVDTIDPRHELVKLAALIDREVFDRGSCLGSGGDLKAA